ncbi:CHAT domain-containing protein [Streptomyces virginiae]
MLGEMIRRDDPGAARWHVEQSLTVATAVKDAQALGLAHYLLADLVGTSDPEEARAHSLQALTFAEATEDLVTQANVHHLLGELALEEDLEQARQQAHRALTLAEAAGSVTIAASAHMLSARVILAGPREQWPAALEPALAAVRQRERLRLRLGSAADRAQFLARTENWDRIALSLAVIRKDGNTGLELAEIGRGEALSALLHLHATEKEVPVRVRQVLADLEEAQAAASAVFDPLPAGLNGPTRRTAAELQADRGEHTRRIERLYAELTALVGNAFRQAFVPDPVDVHELRTRLPPHVHALVLSLLPDEEWSGGRGLVAVWVPPDPHRLPVVERHSLSREQAGWLSALTASDGDHAAGQRLLLDAAHPWRTELAERLLPAGLRAYLSSVDPDGDALPPTISIVPSGELWGLPFAALALADGYLIDHAVLTLVPSLRMLHPATSVKEADEDDSHTRALAYLHGVVGTEVERSQLQGNYSAEDFDEETDPKELLKKLEHGEEYRLLVLAVHGDSQPGLAHSLWLTPTFPLPAARMLNLSMPRCVVLGACWAGRLGLASGEEPIGLPTVALTRDADAITAAIYPVPSQATGAVLAIYYRNLAGGQSAAFALREAQREYVATHPPYSQGTPWHWAGLATLTTTP